MRIMIAGTGTGHHLLLAAISALAAGSTVTTLRDIEKLNSPDLHCEAVAREAQPVPTYTSKVIPCPTPTRPWRGCRKPDYG